MSAFLRISNIELQPERTVGLFSGIEICRAQRKRVIRRSLSSVLCVLILIIHVCESTKTASVRPSYLEWDPRWAIS